MANYETLKSAIQQVVKTNGNNEITGALLQQSLLTMINSLGDGYQYKGIATKFTNPGNPDAKVFYFANGTGTYSNFNEIVVNENSVVILYYDTIWHKIDTGIASNARIDTIGKNYGVLIDGENISKDTEFPILLEYKGKQLKYNVQPVNINGAIAFFDENDQFITYFLGDHVGVVPSNAAKAKVDYGNVNAVVKYQPITNQQLREDIDAIIENVTNYDLRIVNLEKKVDGFFTPKTSTLAYDAPGHYINGANTNGDIYTYSSLSIAFYPVTKGVEYHIQVEKANNSAAYELGYATQLTTSQRVIVIVDAGKGTNSAFSYDLLAEMDGYVVVGYATGTAKPVVTYPERTKGLIEKVQSLEDKTKGMLPSILGDKTIMCFGDSLTAASTTGVNGFMKLIAELLNLPYRRFVRDSADGNTDDVPVDFPSITNYAKDGTTNAIKVGRTDSILERVKRHILANTNVDYVLVECSVNDPVSQGISKGAISSSYTEQFDTGTTIGAIEETCKYLTDMGKDIKIGFFIPWNIWYIDPTYYDDYAAVFNKWGVPFFDMRFCSGFNFRGSATHRAKYSLSQASYETYDSTKTYNLDDKVKYGGSLYKCLADNVINIVPTNTTYWQLLADGNYDGCHLNDLGHSVVYGKILKFIESL